MSSALGGQSASGSGRSHLMRWLIAVVAYPIGGFVGHLIGGPAATVPAALISGLIAGAVIGLGQALALAPRPQTVALWVAAAAVGLGASLALVTALIGQIDTTADAVLLGAVSGLAIGAVQAALLMRERLGAAVIWVATSAIAWALGWATTASIGVALVSGWPVYGVSGAVVSQLITGVVLWKLMSRGEATALAPA